MLTKISKCHKILADRQKKKVTEFPHDQHTYNKVCLKLNEKRGSSRLLKILTSEILESDPQTKLKLTGIKSTLPICTVVARVPNFRPFHSTISRFQDIAHFSIFPLIHMLKFQSAIEFLNVGRVLIYTISFYSLMTTLLFIKFGSDRGKLEE